MDSRLEIARDEWWQAHLYGCETCRHAKRAKTGKYFCDNEDIENYGMYAEDIYGCDDWIEGGYR
jgi:hypothetical protein